MIAAWLVFPIVMLVVCTGCGLLLDAVSGWRLPGVFVPLSGLALLIVAMSFTTNSESTSEASTPLLCVLAVIGYGVGHRRIRTARLDLWGVIVGLVAFAFCAAPLVVSGNATFLGYFILSDSAFHMGLANLLVGHGPNLYDIKQQSGYTSLLFGYLTSDYPTGADVALGGLSKLTGQDVSWTFQPYIGEVVAFGAAAVYGLLGEVISSRRLRAACALLAGVNGLLYSLYNVASIKELTTASVLTLLAFVIVKSVENLRPRALVTVVVVTACTFDVLGVTALPWVGVPVAVFVLASLWRLGPDLRRLLHTHALPRPQTAVTRLAPLLTAAALGLVAIGYPILTKASTFFTVSSSVLNSSSDTNVATSLSYLASPLSKWQMLGIWPDYDFRFQLVAHLSLTHAWNWFEVASAVVGGVWMLRTRRWPPLILLAGSGIAAAYLLSRSTPYAASKVMLIASVALVATVTTGAAALHSAPWRLGRIGRVGPVAAWFVVAVLAAGVLWTDGLAYRYDSIAPSGRLHELATINRRFAGDGPTLYPYGADWTALYLFRSVQPTDGLLPGIKPRAGYHYTGFATTQLRWDTDNLDPAFVQSFNLIVMDGSPAFSRPPADFKLVYRGRYYNVWRRSNEPQVIENVGFGAYPHSSAIASCRVVSATARTAERDHARLAYVRGTPTATLIPAHVAHPFGWVPIDGSPLELIPRGGPGTLHSSITAPRSGTYQVWFDGSFSQKFVVSVDGREVGSIAYQLGALQQATDIGTVHLSAGRHEVTITRPTAGGLEPGTDDVNPNNRAVGPLMFVHNETNDTVSTIAPSHAKTLCGKSLDWLEIVR